MEFLDESRKKERVRKMSGKRLPGLGTRLRIAMLGKRLWPFQKEGGYVEARMVEQ